MDEYRKYLAENILSEEKVITYRFLSRALKVHVNVAKQMLFDFHEWQNAKRPGTVHAAYLLYGTKRSDEASSQSQSSKDGDTEMTNSMPESERAVNLVPTLTLSLVPEEQLQDALETYEEITSIHIYSLGPHPMKDMALLIDAAQQLLSLPAATGSSGTQITYSSIINLQARRRERRGPGAKPLASKVQTAVAKMPVKAAPVVKEEPKAAEPLQATEPISATAAPVQAKKPVPTLKKGGSSGSGIMQSFAKAAAAKAKKGGTSQSATPSGDDSSMHPMSEGEEDDSAILQKPEVQDKPGRKTKKEREEELRRMMEEDEEEEAEKSEEAEERADSPVEEPVEEPSAAEAVKEEPAEVISASGDGRRRGKRRIMKKTQILDDNGYLVTIQKPGWESFSEDEAPPPATKPKLASSAPTAPATKTKKGTPKGSQGSIMSFFSKR